MYQFQKKFNEYLEQVLVILASLAVAYILNFTRDSTVTFAATWALIWQLGASIQVTKQRIINISSENNLIKSEIVQLREAFSKLNKNDERN